MIGSIELVIYLVEMSYYANTANINKCICANQSSLTRAITVVIL